MAIKFFTIIAVFFIQCDAAIVSNCNLADNSDDETVAANATLTGRTFTITAEAGLHASSTALAITDEDTTDAGGVGSDLQLTLTQLQNLSTANQSVVGVDGTIVLNNYSTSGDDYIISYNYIPTAGGRDHDNAQSDLDVVEQFSLVATDADGNSNSPGVLDILITDTSPTAALDTASVTEDASPSVVTGDVRTNDTSGADTDTSVSAIDFGGSQTVGSPFNTTYGTLDLNSDGTYSYTLDNGNATVQALDSGDPLVETFTYTIVDKDGDTSSTTLTVTINGADEAPSVIIVDNDSTPSVDADEAVPENSTLNGEFTVTAAAGLHASSTALTIVDENAGDTGGNTLNLTLSQLQNLSTSNQQAVGADGTITLNDYTFTAGSPNQYIVKYTFDPTCSSRDHSGGDTRVIEQFSIVATDTNNNSNSPDVLDILITDTDPTATNNDAGTVTEDAATLTVTGNAVTENEGSGVDTIVDTTIDPVTSIAQGVSSAAVSNGSPNSIVGTYGTLTIQSDGSYTYTLDDSSAAVQTLGSSDTPTETFTYTITHSDNDTATASITVTVQGVEDVTTFTNGGGSGGDGFTLTGPSLVEASGSTTASQTFTVTNASGITSLDIQ